MNKDIINKLVAGLITVAIVYFSYKILSGAISAYKKRNVGLSGGADDGSNLALDVYNTFSIGYDRDEVSEVSSRLLALSNEDLMSFNDKFVYIYGDKCAGGGIFCNDTTSLKTYISGVWCLYGCKNYYALVERLNALGL